MTASTLDFAEGAGHRPMGSRTSCADEIRRERSQLCCLGRRRPATVVDVEGDDDLAERLRSAGLWPGTEVEIVGASIFGDPILVELHGFRLALRRNEAQRVTVRVPPEGTERPA